MATYYIVSGGFDPIHEGHIAMIKSAAEASDGVKFWLIPMLGYAAKKAKTSIP